MRYGSLRTKRLACSRVSQPLEMAACAASCALVTMSANIVFPFVFGFVLCCARCELYVMGCGGVQLLGWVVAVLLGESWVWLLWQVEKLFLLCFSGAGFLGGFVGVALVAEDAEVF